MSIKEQLIIGNIIVIGYKYSKYYGLEAGSHHLIIEGFFEEDNGLYTSTSVAPSILIEDEYNSIYHLFGNDLEYFMDCKIISSKPSIGDEIYIPVGDDHSGGKAIIESIIPSTSLPETHFNYWMITVEGFSSGFRFNWKYLLSKQIDLEQRYYSEYAVMDHIKENFHQQPYRLHFFVEPSTNTYYAVPAINPMDAWGKLCKKFHMEYDELKCKIAYYNHIPSNDDIITLKDYSPKINN